ncbi:MAG: hypothetical protein JOZ48_24000 [Acidobacteriaceae bacterium]|nr:hypothetical protein [Acidobacteriaceae bacterium]
MKRLLEVTNQISPAAFGDLTDYLDRSVVKVITPNTPLLATPAAVAAGVTLTVAAFGAGVAIGYTAS